MFLCRAVLLGSVCHLQFRKQKEMILARSATIARNGLDQGCGKGFITTSVIPGNPIFKWEALFVAQKWIPFPTALVWICAFFRGFPLFFTLFSSILVVVQNSYWGGIHKSHIQAVF